jgi:hypothetical protein
MEITSEATVDTIENSVNIVTHTKCTDCNHIKVTTLFEYRLVSLIFI